MFVILSKVRQNESALGVLGLSVLLLSGIIILDSVLRLLTVSVKYLSLNISHRVFTPILWDKLLEFRSSGPKSFIFGLAYSYTASNMSQ